MFGGIVSLVCTIITLAYAVLVTFQLVTFSNCNYMSQLDLFAYDQTFQIYSTENNNVTLNENNTQVNFNLAFGILDENFMPVPALNRYLTLQVQLYAYVSLDANRNPAIPSLAKGG